ncbi:MAG: SMC-Scp complex subunit ScpB [Acidimicrobiia bacterium]
MDSLQNLNTYIEAILMAASEPVSSAIIADLLECEEQQIDDSIASLNESYINTSKGFRINKVESGYRFVTSPEAHDVVAKFIKEPMHARLSSSAMETLAVIAYKQPVSRGQIASIRGVNVDSVIKTLESRGYISEIARDSGPGQAILYGTTPEFLERLGLTSLSQLPSLGGFRSRCIHHGTV